MNEEKVIYFAKHDYRGQGKTFGIKPNDRSRHVYVVGKTGMGKSTLLENMAVQDIRNGNGMAFIDPHGATAETLLAYVPEERIQDVIYFAPFDIDHPVSFNVMEDVGYDKRHLVASGLMSAFKKIWQDAWSARMEYILTNTLLALLEYPDSTLIDVNKMLIDKDFRKKVLEHVHDPIVKSFWVDEFAKYTDRYTQEATPAIQNKIGQFVSNPLIRNIIGQKTSSFDIRTVMDEKKILIMNLSKGRMGDTNTQLLGSMLVIKIYLAAMSRADLSPKEVQKLPNFYFFVDEFQSFANETFADILSEARKYKLNLTIAHQYIEQMPEEVRDAVFGNVGTMIAFRVGAFDAEVLEKEFAPVFTAEDIVNLGFAQIYLKLMIDGLSSKPFSATTLPPLEYPEINNTQAIIDYTRGHYAKGREGVEDSIRGQSASAGVSAPSKEVEEKKAPPVRAPRESVSAATPHAREEVPRERVSAPAPLTREDVPVERRREAPRERRADSAHSPQAEPPRPPRETSERAPRPAPKERVVPAPVQEKVFPKKEEANRPFKSALTEMAPRPKEKEEVRVPLPVPHPSPQNERDATPPTSVSLKFLRPNKKDERSPEHLSELRKALGEALAAEESNAKEPEEAKQEVKKSPPVFPRREEKPRIPSHPQRVERPAGHSVPVDRGAVVVPMSPPRTPPEIPEDTLRKMLEVERGQN